MSTFGDLIRKTREEKGWNQQELSLNSGVKGPVISRIESGKVKNPNEDTIIKLADALGLPKTLLFNINKNNDDNLLRVGFGHCIWSAPIASIIMEKNFTNILDLMIMSFLSNTLEMLSYPICTKRYLALWI